MNFFARTRILLSSRSSRGLIAYVVFSAVVSGAVALINVPSSPFLNSLTVDGAGLSCALYLALGAVGLAFSVSHLRQIKEREAATEEIFSTRTFLHTVIEHMPALVVVKEARDHRYVLINRMAEMVLGVSREHILGKRAEDLFAKDQGELVSRRDRQILQSRAFFDIGEVAVDTPQIGARVLRTKKVPILGKDGEPEYLLAVSEDVTECKRCEERVAHLALHDALTGLPNRKAFSEELSSTLERHAAGSFALLCLNLDRFREINDVFGDSIGDRVLWEAARRIHSVLDGAFLARLGADEFTVISAQGSLPETAAALADRLLAIMSGEFEIDGKRIYVGMSVGVAMFPADGRDAAMLLANADAALSRAKSGGGGAIRFFDAKMDTTLRERRALQQELQSALECGELFLNYQPQALTTGDVVGFEALLRWRNKKRGLISPANFIPLAEDSGLIVVIGEWMLRAACREAASWPRPLQVAVNLSPVQFRHGDLPALVHMILLETGLAPERLELEITEGVLIDDFSRALAILRRLKLLGVRIAVDDFGTGYSSLSYLQSFPFDKIKIDRVFIANLDKNQQSAAIIRALIELGRGLDLPVVAEGVETAAQLEFLAREACDEVQGYLIGHPRPIDDYAGLVGRPRSTAVALAG
jgi:diguanylate cyclase (GGDEF)-like protein/PAS domain S-box-containing protein